MQTIKKISNNGSTKPHISSNIGFKGTGNAINLCRKEVN
jgi:hypothetical protein